MQVVRIRCDGGCLGSMLGGGEALQLRVSAYLSNRPVVFGSVVSQ